MPNELYFEDFYVGQTFHSVVNAKGDRRRDQGVRPEVRSAAFSPR